MEARVPLGSLCTTHNYRRAPPLSSCVLPDPHRPLPVPLPCPEAGATSRVFRAGQTELVLAPLLATERSSALYVNKPREGLVLMLRSTTPSVCGVSRTSTKREAPLGLAPGNVGFRSSSHTWTMSGEFRSRGSTPSGRDSVRDTPPLARVWVTVHRFGPPGDTTT